MPFQKGNTHGQGRKKGSKNKRTDELHRLVDEKYPGWNPVVALLDIAHDDEVDISLRAKCINEAASYLYPKLRSVDVTGEMDLAGTVTVNLGKPDGA